MIDLPEIKICSTCNKPKPLMDYYFTRSGLKPYAECKKCKNERTEKRALKKKNERNQN